MDVVLALFNFTLCYSYEPVFIKSSKHVPLRSKGAIVFFRSGGVQNLQKVGINKTTTHLFRQQKIYDPHITDTPYPLNRLKCIKISLFEQNKHNMGQLVTPYILVITPSYFSFQKFMTPSIFGTPHSEENDSPLNTIISRNEGSKFLIQTLLS